MNQGGQAIFRPLTSDLDDITMTVGSGVKLQLVFGDITNETTDAVVNTTDFINFQYDGVCKDILTIAGPNVEAELKEAKVKRGDVFVSQPGQFPCEAILHVCGEKDVGIIEQLVCNIIEQCETFGFKSVAIPAICAGVGGLDPGVVAGAILRGVKAATSSTFFNCLTDIHLVLIKINVFLAFKEEAMQTFSTAVINRVSVPQVPPAQQEPLSTVTTDLSTLDITSTSQQSVFLFLGLCRKDVDDAMTKLKNLYQAQCSTKTFKKEELASLTQDDIKDLELLVEIHGLYMQMGQSGQNSLTVSGLKDGVNQVTQLINASMHGSLRRQVRVREEEDLYTRVAWCILGQTGNWERLPKTANHNLENNDIAGGIVDAQGISWSVDLQRLEATRQITGQKMMLKRLVNLPDFTLPLYWDNMAAGEDLKKVVLQPSSAEYRTVKEAFKRTVSKTVMKIERLQNVHLRRAYEVQKKHISDKNRQEGGAGEKLLYHGTTQDNCDSIMKTGFNRRFAGQNATAYGHGTYFAVNASYSAQPTYSKPATDGTQLMFVARVLTGVYTPGQSDMRVPPPRSVLQPHDRYDSVVDKTHNPNMFVVFHDNQAYPDYLITFK
ncbi:protein mono-ADP-ribosyltransferase PARP14-like [Symphorus nematophorus]